MFLVALVVAAVFGVNTAALGCFQLVSNFETCFTILVAVSCPLCSFNVFTSWNTSILHSTGKLSSSSQHSALWYKLCSIASARPPELTNTSLRKKKKLLPRSYGSPWSRIKLWSTTIQQYTLAQFLLVDVHESIHPCLCGNTRPRLQYSSTERVLGPFWPSTLSETDLSHVSFDFIFLGCTVDSPMRFSQFMQILCVCELVCLCFWWFYRPDEPGKFR